MTYGLGKGWSLVGLGPAVLFALVGSVSALGCSAKDREYPGQAGGSAGAGPSTGGTNASGGGEANAGGSPDAGAAGDNRGGEGAGVCTPDERRCSEAGVPQVCDAQGSAFVDQEPCAGDKQVCDSEVGTCIGPCPSGDQRCTSEQTVQECDADGLWQNSMQCPFACLESGISATCGGDCKPGERTCGANQTPYQCDDSGTPQPEEPCANVCTGAGECSGDCSPTATQCSPSTPGSEETCLAEGIWGPAEACTFVCDAATQACGGECKPGSPNQCSGKTIQTCQANGTWKSELDCAALPCSQGECKACTPQAKQCNAGKPQTCSAGGDWVDDQATACPFVCNAVTGLCAGECVPGTDACVSGTSKRCGASGTYNAGTVCPNICVTATGKCGGDCKPGTKQCTGATAQTCSSAGVWGMDTACQYGCNTTSGQCNGCTDEAAATTCAGNKCGVVINNCGNTVPCPGCGDGKFCNGVEACVASQCQNAPTGPCTVADTTNCSPTCTEGTSAANCGVTGKDADGDGHKTDKCVAAAGDDCDDTRTNVRGGTPLVPEACDGLDNDCDGKIDVADGVAVGGAVVEVGPAANSRWMPEIAWSPEQSRYGIVYYDTTSSPAGIQFTAINQAGAVQAAIVNVGDEPAGSAIHLIWGADNFGLAWYSGTGVVRFRTVGANGSVGLIRPVFAGIAARPQLARIGTGTWAVSYLDYGDNVGYQRAHTVAVNGTVGAVVPITTTETNFGLLVATSNNFVTAVELKANSSAQASAYDAMLGSAASLVVSGLSPVLGSGPNGFAIGVEKAGNQPELYSFDHFGNASCGPVKFADASFQLEDVVGTADGYLVVSGETTRVRAQLVKNDCSLGPLFTVDAAAGYNVRVSGGSAGYGVVWDTAASKVKRRFFGPKFCD